jgi:hypothetical protein
VHEVSRRAWGLRLRRTEQGLALSPLSTWPSAHYKDVGVRIASFRSSIAHPAYSPVYASLRTSRYATQNSGPSGSLLLPRKNLPFSASCRLSGKAMARTGLRMMPTFPSPPLKFRTASFPRYGFKAGISDEAFPKPGLPSSFVPTAVTVDSLLCVRDGALVCTSVRAVLPLYPRGPRSGPGYAVPIHLHLIGPIRPTRGHISTSPPSDLYQMPSLCLFA